MLVNELLRTVYGSHLYGTSTPSSDFDYKVVYLPPLEDVLLGKEKKLKTKELSAMYSLTISMCYTLREWADKAKNKEDGMDIDIWHGYVDNFLPS